MQCFDISPEVTEQTAVFPGDTAFKRTVLLNYEQGSRFLLSKIETTVHVGAHCDAPNHYHPQGSGIEKRDLHHYMGLCQVIEPNGHQSLRIKPTHITGKPIQAPRVLFKTKSFPNPNKWTNEFHALSPELVEHLAKHKVILVGIDTPSVDPAQDKDLSSHNAIAKHDLAILEGIVLDNVPEGLYTLVALPLKIKNADASPVRAVLIAGDLFGEKDSWKKS